MKSRAFPPALLGGFLFLLSPGPARAADSQFVLADVARVRSKSQANGPVVGLLRINTPVELQGAVTQDPWVEISVPDSKLKGWVVATSLRPAKVTLEEAREETGAALANGDKAKAVAWADRLRALSPAEVKDLTLARKVYARFKDKDRTKTVEETLAGQQPIYLATCVRAGRWLHSELAVLAEFDARGGLSRVASPQSLSRWIAGSPWYEAREASTRAQLLEGGAFAAARFMPGSDTEHIEGADEESAGTYIARAALSADCGSHDPSGVLVTWPFERVAAPAPELDPEDAAEAEALESTDAGAPDAGAPDAAYSAEASWKIGHKRVWKRREAIELTLGGEKHRFEIEILRRDNLNCEDTSRVRVTHHTARGESTVEILVSQEIGC